MTLIPNMVKQNSTVSYAIDAIDRKILGALVADAGQSYASLGDQVGLSSPAVHERVKKLKRAGVVKSISAILDPVLLGKSMLSYVHIDTTGWGKSKALLELADFPEIEEIHSVAGDTCIILKVRTRNPQDLESLLQQLYALPQVTATRSYVVLSTYLERPLQAEVTTSWPSPAHR